MEDLIKALPVEELEALKAKYSTNESITKLVDGYLETKKAEEAKIKIKAEFEAKILKLAKLPKPPEDIHNLYLRWAEVEDTEAEAEAVNINGTTEMRKPKVWKWVIETNKAFQVAKGSTTTPKVAKRSITVYKRNGTQLELIGNFASATKACESLKLAIGGDSANRVLARSGYITEAYNGNETT